MKDYKHIYVFNDVDYSFVSPRIKQLANFVRYKMYGIDVREAIARGFEWQSMTVTKYLTAVNHLTDRYNQMAEEFKNTLNGLTQDSEVKNARINVFGETFTTLKEHLDNIEENSYILGPVALETDDENTLRIIGLTETSKKLHLKVVSETENKEVRGGLYTNTLDQIKLEVSND